MASSATAKKRHSAKGLLAGLCVAAALVAGGIGVTFGLGESSRATLAFGSDDAFGLGTETVATTTSVALLAEGSQQDDLATAMAALSSVASRDIDKNIESINAFLEAQRIAAEQALREEEARTLETVTEKIAEQRATAGIPAGLDNVDWSVGKEAFIAEWTARIDAYMAGFPLEGYGEVFATAAWEHCIDPRLSPAISRTESTSGKACFKPHNAWGWGSSSWSSWEQAINAHITGVAEVYGYTVSLSMAQVYCPPTYQSWYSNTYSQMLLI